MDKLSLQEFKAALPPQLDKRDIDQRLIDNVNNVLTADPEFFRVYKDNILTYTRAMTSATVKTETYLLAVKYVSYKLLGMTNQEAYIRTFPDRYKSMLARGLTQTEISSFVKAWNKSKIVNIIFEQTIVPSWVLNQDMYQNALNVQANLMVNAKSEMVRCTAANSILLHLKPPEVQKYELNIGAKEGTIDIIEALRDTTLKLAERQKELLENKLVSTNELARENLILEAQYTEVENGKKGT